MSRRATQRRGAECSLAMLLALSITGCSVALFPEQQSQRVFTLPYSYSPQATTHQQSRAIPALKVARPHASGVLNGQRVIIEAAANELAAYEGIRWMTDAPALLQDHLVRALRDDPRLGTVVSDISGAGSDLVLTSEIMAFQERSHGGEPGVLLQLQAQLVENGSRRVVATKDVSLVAPVSGDGIEPVVAAFGEASDRLAAELADWLAAELQGY